MKAILTFWTNSIVNSKSVAPETKPFFSHKTDLQMKLGGEKPRSTRYYIQLVYILSSFTTVSFTESGNLTHKAQ